MPQNAQTMCQATGILGSTTKLLNSVNEVLITLIER